MSSRDFRAGGYRDRPTLGGLSNTRAVMMLKIRTAVLDDLPRICNFVDFWLSGRGKRVAAPGAVDDYFVSSGQQRKYIVKYKTWLCMDGLAIICWGVVEPSGTMITLLVAGDRRNEGIGSMMVKHIKPKFVRSKSDQSSGNPIVFYEKLGYIQVDSVKSRSRLDIDKLRPVRAENIDILVRGDL